MSCVGTTDYSSTIGFYLSTGPYGCGTDWNHTWATASLSQPPPLYFGPWYSEAVQLAVNWTGGTTTYEQSSLVDAQMTNQGSYTYLAFSGGNVEFEPTSLYAATGLVGTSDTWPKSPLYSFGLILAGIACPGTTVTFVPTSNSSVTRSIGSGFHGELAFLRTGYITGCTMWGAPTNFPATETWGGIDE
jgi:hypothetical protein